MECLEQLQRGHLLLAKGDLEESRKAAKQAVKCASEELGRGTPVVRDLAQFALDFYALLKNGPSFETRLLWLTCAVNGVQWLPLLHLGNFSLLDVAPLNVSVPPTVPNFPGVEWKNVHVDRAVDKDLYQDLLPNCSFVLSMLSVMESGRSDLLLKCVRVFGNRAKVRLHVNGCEREIAVDTTLPFLPHEPQRRLFVLSTSGTFWPAIIEKAYLMTHGGYDFSGLNMANDTFMLTGWIPEVRRIERVDRGELLRLWLEQGVTLGVGTGKMSNEWAAKLSLIANHDYVICSVDSDRIRLMNPWMNNSQGQRCLDVPFSALPNFSWLYVNYCPDHYQKQKLVFYSKGSSEPEGCLGEYPQFSISCPQQEVLVVVEQFLETRQPFRCLLFEATGKVVTDSQYLCVAKSKFPNQRVQLLRAQCAQNTLVVAGKGPMAVWVYLARGTALSKLSTPPSQKISGSWALGRNGGNYSTADYVYNPQYDLTVAEPTTVEFLATSAANLNVHVFFQDPAHVGRRLRAFEETRLVSHSDYSRIHHSEVALAAGTYRVVVSSYTKEEGDFQLTVFGDAKLDSVPAVLGLFTETYDIAVGPRDESQAAQVLVTSTSATTFHILCSEPIHAVLHAGTTQTTQSHGVFGAYLDTSHVGRLALYVAAASRARARVTVASDTPVVRHLHTAP